MNSSTSADYIDFSGFFDTELGGLDEFDYILGEDDGHGGFEFGGSPTNSNESSEMDLQIETEMIRNCDVIQEQVGKACFPARSVDYHYHSCRGKRERSLSPCPQHKQQVNFDLSAERFGYSDLSMSLVSISSEAPSVNQQVFEESASIRPYSKDQYNEALNNLAESMKRSELTRRHVMLQRDMLAPEQQRALYLAKTQLLNQQNKQVKQQTQHAQRQTQQTQLAQQRQQQLSFTIVNHPLVTSFFNCETRASFADKMEQRRKKIGMYMGQVNQSTL
mmetsp:Transcript_37154/g.80200  ORF Transcript_37154/g.80200 Transcript_37154/m.80200 type:complete len:276 (+) Transcript_37154:92-919(+)